MSSPPPFTATPAILTLVATIGEQIGRLEAQLPPERQVLLRRGNRIRTVQGSLAIEGNTLSLEQVTAVIEGKRVLGSARELQEVRGAIAAYEAMTSWDPASRDDLLAAHGILMAGLVDRPGAYRKNAAGIQRGGEVVHIAPPATYVRGLMNDLLAWLAKSDDHPLIQACVFHYEFEVIHPFVDGNGRMGRLWQTLILSRWKPLFALVPVESLIRDEQAGYYAAINASDQQASATPFIAFMLDVIQRALDAAPGTEQVTEQVAEQVERLLRALRSGPASAKDLMATLDLRHRPNFMATSLGPAMEAGLVAMTRPDKPTSRLQQYRLTAAGEAMLAKLGP